MNDPGEFVARRIGFGRALLLALAISCTAPGEPCEAVTGQRQSWAERSRQVESIQERLAADRTGRGFFFEYERLLAATRDPVDRSALESLWKSARSQVVRDLLRPEIARGRLARGDTLAALPLLAVLAREERDDADCWLDQWIEASLRNPAGVSSQAVARLRQRPGQVALKWVRSGRLEAALTAEQGRVLEVASLAALGRVEEALALCENEASQSLRELRAGLLLRAGRWPAGRSAWLQLDGQPGVGDRALLAVARSHKAAGDTSAAINAYLELGKRFPQWQPRALWVAAWLEEARGRVPSALELLNRLLRAPGSDSLRDQVLLHKILLELDSGHSREARRDAKELERRAGSAILADAGRYWGWVAAGRPGALPELREPVSAYRWFVDPPPAPQLSDALLERGQRRHERLLEELLRDGPEMRAEIRNILNTATALTRVGWLDWARAECRQAEMERPRNGPEAWRLASISLRAGALDVYLRTVRPRLRSGHHAEADEALLLHPLRFLPSVQAALSPRADPLLACAIIEVESAGNPAARSPAGALGLMQLLPRTAVDVALRAGLPPPDGDALLQPDVNIRLGCAYLDTLLDRFGGREERAIAAYNAGPDAVERWERQNPGADPVRFMDGAEFAETRRYLRRVLAARLALRRALEGVE